LSILEFFFLAASKFNRTRNCNQKSHEKQNAETQRKPFSSAHILHNGDLPKFMLRQGVNKLLVHQLRIFSVAASTVHDIATKNLGRSKMQTKELADSSAYNDGDDDDDNDDPSAQQQQQH